MGIVAQIEFDGFPESTGEAQKSTLALYLELAAKDGGLIPQAMLHEALGVSRQRVSQYVSEGRFKVHAIGGSNYVTGDSFQAFLLEERRVGRPVKPPTVSQLATAAREFISEEKVKIKKSRK